MQHSSQPASAPPGSHTRPVALVRGAARRWAAGAAAVAVLVGMLSVQNDILRLVPQRAVAGGRLGLLAVAAAIGAFAVRTFVEALFTGERRESLTVARTLTSWTGYALLVLFLTSAVGINLSGFLLGSAVLGVIVGVAAQSSLGNIFAGIVLMMARPYRVGDWAYVRSATFAGGEYEGIVLGVGALYTTLASYEQVLRIPNSAAITAAVRTDDVPVRASLDVTLRSAVSPRVVRRAVRSRLELESTDRVLLRPVSLDLGSDGGSMKCRLEVRAARRIDQGALVEAVRESAHGSPAELAAAGRADVAQWQQEAQPASVGAD